MRISVGDQLPVKPGDTVTVDLFDVVLHIGDLTGTVEAAPFLDDETLAGVLGLGDGVAEIVIVSAAKMLLSV